MEWTYLLLVLDSMQALHCLSINSDVYVVLMLLSFTTRQLLLPTLLRRMIQ